MSSRSARADARALEAFPLRGLARAVIAALATSGLVAAGCSKSSDCVAEGSCGGVGGKAGAGGAGGSNAIPCPASGVLRGPWAMRFDATSAVVRWDACRASDAHLSLEPEAGGAAVSVEGTQTATLVKTAYKGVNGVPPDLAGTYYLTEVKATGLTPGACYHYTLAAEPARGGRFCTARPSGDGYHFVAIGDTNPVLGHTAGVIAQAIAPDPPDFVLHVGDIEYYASVFESWSNWFPSMQPLLSAGAFMPAVGNHEYEVPTEFVDYYERIFGGAGFDGANDYWRYESGGVWFFTVNTENDYGPGTVQGDWLAASIADAAGKPGHRMSVVYFHRPMITLADFSQATSERDYFAPLFQKYGVKLVFQGHVHGYERFVDDAHGITYVTTGGGGAALHDLDVHLKDRPVEAAMRKASKKTFESVKVVLGATSLDAQAVGEQGEIIDTFSVALP